MDLVALLVATHVVVLIALGTTVAHDSFLGPPPKTPSMVIAIGVV